MRNIRRVALGALCLCLLTSCWDRTEMNTMALVLAAGIDAMEDGGFSVTVQVVDPSQMTKNRAANRNPALLYTEEGRSVSEALRRITTKSSRKMHYSHMKILLINEPLARKGFAKPLDLVFRTSQARPDFKIAVVRGFTTRDVLSVVTPFEVNPAMDLHKSLEVSQRMWAPTSATRMLDLEMTLELEGREPVLTGITLIGNVEGAKSSKNVAQPASLGEYKYRGLGVFHNDRLLGWLDESASKSYAYLTNTIHRTVGSADCPDSKGFFVVEIYRAKSKIVPKTANGRPSVLVKLEMDANINEVQCDVDLTKESEFLALQKAAAAKAIETLERGVAKVQLFGADIYGIGEAFHRKYPRQWKEWKISWRAEFKRLPVTFEVDYRLHGTGNINKPIQLKSR